MLKIFLVEDESIIREGLRENIPWQQYGYQFVGEAADGEQALPLILREKPDVLITDIKMPFMDGLELSRLVVHELPGTKIIIISGYDDFEYARSAIDIGVEQYLLKPITKAMLIKTLQEVHQKIEAEREQESYMEKFRDELEGYKISYRNQFFEEVLAGKLSVGEIYERADKLDLNLRGPWYNLVMYHIQGILPSEINQRNPELLPALEEQLEKFFRESTGCLPVRQNIMVYTVLIHGEKERVASTTEEFTDLLKTLLAGHEKELEWHAAIGDPVERLSSLPMCYREVSKRFSYRHLMQGIHVFSGENIVEWDSKEEQNLKHLDMNKIDPSILLSFLQNGEQEELLDFVEKYTRGLRDAMKSRLFCQYLLLNVRFTTTSYLEGLGYEQEEFLNSLEGIKWTENAMTEESMKGYIQEMMEKALAMREKLTRRQYNDIISQALVYIDENFTSESISLTDVAKQINVSANYFSAVFSQEMKQTFVEYLTFKRMEKAKELLKNTDKRSAEIAAEVGYKDSHYFSFVFRKTQGCTPRDYRSGGRKG